MNVKSSDRSPVPSDDRNRRRVMVECQIAARGIRDERVLAALSRVPRHRFLPADRRDDAYGDHPLPIGRGQTISQPYIVALMTEALELDPRHRVLEIGTGSGYQAAVLAELVAEVCAIEYRDRLADRARRTLAAAGYANVHVVAGDGWAGWPAGTQPAEGADREAARSAERLFDAALITCAVPEPPPAVLDQIRFGGRLCVPLGPPGGVQDLRLFVRGSPTGTSSRSLGAVRFVPVLGHGARRG